MPTEHNGSRLFDAGRLVGREDAAAMAAATNMLADDGPGAGLRENAGAVATARLDVHGQRRTTLAWSAENLADWQASHPRPRVAA